MIKIKKFDEKEKLQEYKSIPTINGYKLNNIDIIYNNYCKSMEKRRPGTCLEYDQFKDYLENNDVYFFNYKDSYIIGQYQGKLFIPTHFAPYGLREGVELVKALKNYDNVAFVVTPDLSGMLKKIGFKVLPIKVIKNFRGVEVEKSIAVSNLFFSTVLQLYNIAQSIIKKIKDLFKPKLKLKKKNRKNLFNNYSQELKQKVNMDVEEIDDFIDYKDENNDEILIDEEFYINNDRNKKNSRKYFN